MNKLVTLLFGLFAVQIAVSAELDPHTLIQQTADHVLAEIKDNSGRYKDDPELLYELVDKVVLPHFNFTQMTKLALGKYARKVNADQKPLIVNEFRILLVRTYGKALLEYNDQTIRYLPLEGSTDSGKVVVKTEIGQSGGSPIPLNYRLRLGKQGWKVYDIIVDGISLVTNYRSSFARQIKKNGIDGLIKTLRDRNQ